MKKSCEKLKNILLVEGIHESAKKSFEKKGFQTSVLSSSADEKELKKLSPFLALGIRSRTRLSSSFFNQEKNLWAVGAFCIGVNQIDLAAAAENGVAVFNSPYSNTRSVAELVIANIINLSRKITHLNSLAHAGKWKKTAKSSYEVRGKTLGIIGYGHIGSQVSILAESLSMKVYYYDIEKKLSLGSAQSVSSLKKLLPLCDFITLHVPQTPQTKNIITKKEIQLMKNSCFLINTSRGETVCLQDLASALKEGRLSGAALDVFPKEPASNTQAFSNCLQNLSNVILTPHIGGSTEEAQLGIAQDAADRLAGYLLRGDSSDAVNFPRLSPPPFDPSHTFRTANIHKNTPGVLSQINSLISQWNINVQAQYLSTAGPLGYLIMDLDTHTKPADLNIIQEIQNLKTSVKTRALPFF